MVASWCVVTYGNGEKHTQNGATFEMKSFGKKVKKCGEKELKKEKIMMTS